MVLRLVIVHRGIGATSGVDDPFEPVPGIEGIADDGADEREVRTEIR